MVDNLCLHHNPSLSPRRVSGKDEEEQSAWSGTRHAVLPATRERLVSARTDRLYVCRSIAIVGMGALLRAPGCVGGCEAGVEPLLHLLRCRDEFKYEDQALTDSAELKIDQVRGGSAHVPTVLCVLM